MLNKSHYGQLYVIAAPSGTGKTSLVRQLITNDNDILVSISHTTRSPRPNEKEAVDYFFIDENEFTRMVKKNHFLEHARVHDNFYGTSKLWVDEQLKQGKDVILEIDWQGAMQIRQSCEGVIGIFILPPSKECLLQRLRDRGQDDEQVIARRMARAEAEISHYKEFEYLVINDDFQCAYNDLRAIVHANRLTRAYQQSKHSKLLSNLL